MPDGRELLLTKGRMRNLNFYGALALSTLSGCLWFLAVTPFDFSALAWLAAVPMLMAIERAGGYRRALFLGWWAGLIETAGGFYWLIDVMRRFADFPHGPRQILFRVRRTFHLHETNGKFVCHIF